jgi:hypothetical protein
MTLGDVGLNRSAISCKPKGGCPPDVCCPFVLGLIQSQRAEGEGGAMAPIECGATCGLVSAEIGEIVLRQIGTEVALERDRVLG